VFARVQLQLQRKLFKKHSTIRSRQTFFSQRVINVWNYLPYGIVLFKCLNAFKRSIVRVDFKSFYNATSLVHSYIVITVFLGLVSGLLLVHSGASKSFSIAYIFVLSFCHVTAAWHQ